MIARPAPRTTSPTLDRRDRKEQEQAVRAAFAEHDWEVPRLLEAMSEAGDFYFGSSCQVHLDRWSHGRVTLVGDAGYCAAPTSGMGTSQALIGAWALAHNPNRPRLPTTQALTGGGVVRIKDSRGELTNAATTTVLQSLGRQGRYAGCRLDHEEDARSEQDPLVMHSRLPSGRSREVRRWSS
ncbi:hypothetical protein AB0H88_23610 [Nonomuraea sp. NPDC050680]|uniref:hypothetical protein n=1 Tax=Nonomuraea sp. NPDC050680 TaxID=3154630 RepID=UPI00340CDE87